jgi:hypothetical protein
MTQSTDELEKLRQIWLTSEDEDDAFAFADACGNALPELLAMAEENARLREALKRAEEIAALIDHVEFYTAENAIRDLQTIRFIARAALKETGQ